MRVVTFLLLLSAAMAAVGCGPRVRGEWDGYVQPQALEAAGLQYYWHVNVQLDKRERIDRLYLLGNDVYCMTTRNRLLAIDAMRGVWRWTVTVANPGQRVFDPILAKSVALPNWLGEPGGPRPTSEMIRDAKPFDAVIVNTLTAVLVIDRASGTLMMRIPLDYPVGTSGTFGLIAETLPVYCVPSVSGTCYGIDLRDGLAAWHLPIAGAISAPPVLHDQILYVASGEGELGAWVAVGRPRELWRSSQIDSQQMHGAVTAPFVVSDRGCFVPCQDNRLYGFDRLNGRPLWPAVVCQGPLRRGVQMGTSAVFMRADWDKFYAVDILTGKVKWTLPAGLTVLAAVQEKGNNVYVLDQANSLRIVDEATGQETASLPMTGFEVYLPNARAPAIYAATRTGRIVCIRPAAAEPLTPQTLGR